TNVNVGERDGRPGDSDDEFNPNSITITEGDTVHWQWFDGTHNVTPYDPADFAGTSTNHFNGSGDVYDVTFNTAGTVWYYCTLRAEPRDIDTNENGVFDAGDDPVFGKMIGRIDILPAPSDTTPPATSSVAASPNPTDGASNVTLTATVDDSSTGGSSVQAAEYFIDSVGVDGTGTAMAASDGSFDGVTENVTASVDASALPEGDYTLFVHGQDSEGNWGGTDSVVLTVSALPAGVELAIITILGGSLSVGTNPVAFGLVSLSGADLTVDTQPSAWYVSDARGSGAGWNVTLTSTDFTSAGGTITVGNFKMKLDDANIVTVGGNTAPTSQVTGYQPLSTSTPLKLLSAGVGVGMGTYDFTPDARLIVPAESAPGDYEAFM
ncbi:hypothetical protein LCGC14_2933320, partial [marine sediment metagenome]